MCGARRCKSGPDWACAFFATQIFPALGIDVVEVVQNSSEPGSVLAHPRSDDKAEVKMCLLVSYRPLARVWRRVLLSSVGAYEYDEDA